MHMRGVLCTWYSAKKDRCGLHNKMNKDDLATVKLKKGEGRYLKSGGAWIFDNEIDDKYCESA